MDDELTEEQHDYSRVPPQLLPHVYKKGQSGNPSGRPEGISLKEYARIKFRKMTDEEREEFFHGMDKRVLWEMGEGKAEAKADITTNGESINPVLIKFIDADNRDTGGVQETV
jgi:hypothetical protein